MNKSQIVLAAIGGVVVVGALALGYFIWDASSAKSEKATALEDALAGSGTVMRKLPIRPAASELAVYKANAEAFDTWRAEALKIASRGDLVFPATTGAEFKQAIRAEARRLANASGCIDGKFVKADFGFGFRGYVAGEEMPPNDAAELKRLQREWGDVALILKTLAECGGPDVGITDVRMGAQVKAVSAEAEADEPKNKKRKAKKSRKAKAVEAEEAAPASGPAVTAFTVDFLAKPSVIVKALNRFVAGQRFIVVENFTFVREKDEIAEKLGSDAKKAEAQAASSRRRRRGGAAAAIEQKDDVGGGVVTDPATAPLFKVTMAFSVYDFHTLDGGDAATPAKGEEDND